MTRTKTNMHESERRDVVSSFLLVCQINHSPLINREILELFSILPATDVTMAFSIRIVVVLLLNLAVKAEGRVIDEKHVINVPDEYPSRCDDPHTPCKCLDRNSTRIVRDGNGVQ